MRYLLFFVFISLTVINSAQNKTILVGCDYNYPPYSYIDDEGEMVGYDIDIITKIAKLSNVRVEFILSNWDTTLMNLQKGKVDLIASIVYSESREGIYDFTFPLHTEYYSIFAKKETHIVDVHDLESKRAAYLKGDISNDMLLHPMGLLNDSVWVESMPQAFEFIDNGTCDYIIAPYPLGMDVMESKKMKGIEVKGRPLLPSIYCLAVKQGDAKLLSMLNMGIEKLSRSGELEEIYNNWVRYKLEDDQYKSRFVYLIYVLAGLSIVIIILMGFWYSMRVNISKKTKQIKEAEVIYRRVFNTVDDALFVFSSDGNIVDANKKAFQMYGLDYSQIIGRKYINIINEENKKLFQGLMDNLDSDNFQFDKELRKVDGGHITYLRVKGIRISLEKRELYLAVLRNITDEKNSFLKLEEAKKMSDQANSAKSTFLSTMSHEIRTPLNAIIGYANLLLKTKLNDVQLSYSSKIRLSGEILVNLANNILDLTKIEADKLILEKKPFSIRKIVDHVCDIVILKGKNIKLIIDISEDIPHFVLGDELRLSQILLNLINNAIKFTDEGVISVFVNVENNIESDRDRLRVLFSIKDTGIGIPIEKQDILFQPFEQVQKSNARKYGGTGLGLAISKQLVDLMDGDIMVESTVGVGSVFSFSIEFYKAYELDILDDNIIELETDNLEGVAILLVEDNDFNAEILIEQLLEYKCNITRAESGIKALEILRVDDFDIVLMDIEMPQMDGFETMNRIKNMDIKQIPVIALSAHTLDSEKIKAIDIGMVAYLCKPVPINKLINYIHTYVNKDISIKFSNDILNYKLGIEYFNSDKMLYDRALSRFKKSYQMVPNQLNILFKNNDFTGLKDHTHNLKSSAKMIGAEYLAELALEYDKVLYSNPEEFTLSSINALINELEKVLDFIEL